MDLVEQLERLERLHGDGTLTDDEFQRAKSMLLAGQGEADAVEDVAAPRGPRPLQDAAKGVTVRFQAGTPPARLYRAVHRAGGRSMTVAALALEANTTSEVALKHFEMMQKRGLVQIDDTGEGAARSVVRVRPGAPRLDALPPPNTGHRSAPRLGVWAVAVWLFIWVGGLIGYFALKDSDPRRANHVAKWGLIATLVYFIITMLAIGIILVGSR